MTVARFTGSPPAEIRANWSWREIQEFLVCLPYIRQYGLSMGGE